MALYYCVEEEYRNTSWCNETLKGLYSEIKRKKQTVEEVQNINKLSLEIGERSSVIIIGSLKSWISERIAEVSDKGMLPIVLSNTGVGYANKSYSNVSSDVYGALRSAVYSCKACGKGRIALYGINPHSASDTLRKQAFLKAGCSEKDIFNNHGSLKGCFYSFFSSVEYYDTIICANDFVAVSLVTRLKKQGYNLSRLYIISCSDGILLKKISPSVTAFSRNFKAFGKAAVLAHEAFTKNPDIAFTDTHIKYDICIRQTTKGLNLCNEPLEIPKADNENLINIYHDEELQEIMKVENIMRNCDSIDMQIIDSLQAKQTYESIADKLFISLSAVKYRIKNLCKFAGVSGIKALIELVTKYRKK